MNGICYIIPSDLNIAHIKKLPAMVGISKRTEETKWGKSLYNHAMASMGASLHVTNEVRVINIFEVVNYNEVCSDDSHQLVYSSNLISHFSESCFYEGRLESS